MNENAIWLDFGEMDSTISTFALVEEELSAIQKKLNHSVSQLDAGWQGRGKAAFYKEWEDCNSSFQDLLKKVQALRADLEHTVSYMQEADAAGASKFLTEIADTIYQNKEILAALITLAVPVVQSLLERRKQRRTVTEQKVTITLVIEGRTAEVKEDEAQNRQKLLDKLVSTYPDLLNEITPKSTLKILPGDDKLQETAIEVHLDNQNGDTTKQQE